MTEEVIQRTTPDWERVEADYRAGLLSLREIATKDGHVTEGAIRKKAKKLGWTRDLAAKIQAKADDLVRKEAVRIPGTQQTEYAPAAERVLVEANAHAIAGVRLRHRKDISTGQTACLEMLTELSASVKAQDKPLSARAATLKTLTDSLKSLVTLEREAWGLKTDGEGDTPLEPPVIKLGFANGGPGRSARPESS